MSNRTVAIIQARMASTRLPGKVLADLGGAPLLVRVVHRAQRAARLDATLVATSRDAGDDAVAACCAAHGIECFRGDQNDVLDRYYQAARHARADVIVRLTADCPLLDPQVVDRIVATFAAGGWDYVSNTITCTYPDGLDAEACSAAALARAWRDARWSSEREHVTAYIVKHPELFRLGEVRHEQDLSALRWTVDEPEDLDFVRAVYAALGPDAGLADVLQLLDARPDLRGLNGRFTRNEGYAKSLRDDRLVETGAGHE